MNSSLEFRQDPEYGRAPEYDFEDGVKAVLARIEELLAIKDHVVIAINGADEHVGKSELSWRIAKFLNDKEIPTAYFHGFTPGLRDEHELSKLEAAQEASKTNKNKAVFIFGEALFGIAGRYENHAARRTLENMMLQASSAAKRFNLPEVDIWVAIHKPYDQTQPHNARDAQKSFLINNETGPLADIVINNTGAVDKPR